MKYRLMLALLCFAALFFPLTQASLQANGGYVVTGRVVNETGEPVANARIILQATNAAKGMDSSVRHYLTDAEGRFRVRLSASSPESRQTLYVITGLPRELPLRAAVNFPSDLPIRTGVVTPITPPFPAELEQLSSSFSGKAITLKKGQETDVGDVPVQVRYAEVSVSLLDEAGAALAKDDKSPSVLYRIRDSRGDVVAEGNIPSATLFKNGSAAVLALPEGTWNMEFALDNEGKNWRPLNEPLTVQSAGGQIRTSMQLSASDNETSASSNRSKAYRSPEEARNELKRRGFELDQDSFVKRAEMGNADAVELYLDAGINPAIKDKRGTTALIAAAGADKAKVVKALIERGVDISVKNDRGETALIAAASSGSLEAVKALLSKGADVNVKAKNGVTALMVAVGNDHIEVVEALLAAGADVNARDKSGMTALSLAKQADDKDIIELLRKAGAQD